MLLKVIDAGAQDFGEPVFSLIKLSSRGLLGSDRDDFIKRAGAKFAFELDNFKDRLHPDEALVHLIALGATEAFGCNRNFDGFPEKTACENCHGSFVKHARFYRDHQSKDPSVSYGRVKFSTYHKPMKRVELVVGLNSTPEIARLNGGHVADREMEKLAAGKDLGVSMGCKIPFDKCSSCGNKAPTREQYCDSIENGGFCKAGGLKHNIGTMTDHDGQVFPLHAINDICTFYDISHVFRPADRTAYVNGMLKAAGHRHVGGAELAAALGVTLPYELLLDKTQPSDVQRMLKVACQLADTEAADADLQRQRAGAFVLETQAGFTPPPAAREKFAELLRAMVDSREVLSLSQFVQLTTDNDADKSASVAAIASQRLPQAFRRLRDSSDVAEKLASNPYTPAPGSTPAFRKWAEQQTERLSVREPHLRKRAMLGVLRHGVDPELRVPTIDQQHRADDPSDALCEQYTLYKVAFLASLPELDSDFPLTLNALVLQNHVC